MKLWGWVVVEEAGRETAARQWWRSCVAAGHSFHRAAGLGKLDVFKLERVSFGRGSQEMLPLSPRIMPRAAAPRAPLYEENEEEESVLERGLAGEWRSNRSVGG